MATTKPVVVYGASGYTGRLVCEFLRDYGIPFVAAGRDASKVKAAMESNVAGIETADYEVAEVNHDVESLTELFSGAKVVCNMVGPFARFGHETVQAALAAGAHYIDTTGEQDWVRDCDEKYGQQFADAGLLLSPGVAQMYTTGEIAAELCLETPGLDTLDIAVFWGGSPTIASTQTILYNAATSPAAYLVRNQYVDHDPTEGHAQLVIPGQHELGLALPWGGTSHPVWYKNDPRVQNCRHSAACSTRRSWSVSRRSSAPRSTPPRKWTTTTGMPRLRRLPARS
jgi:saccharopine dehydrogenase-like NADP-dependent oxidoreductase